MLTSLFLQGVRSFREAVDIPLAPLTLLVGENSSGKSTLLAAIRLAWDVLAFNEPKFNEAPFVLGSFDSIAHYHGGRGKRVSRFGIGGSIMGARAPNLAPEPFDFRAEFKPVRGQPFLETWSISQGERSWRMNLDSQTGVFRRGSAVVEQRLGNEFSAAQELPAQFVRQQLLFPLTIGSTKDPPSRRLSPDDVEWLRSIAFGLISMGTSRPRAVAPIRTHPQRTYDAVKEEPSPEGGHVPALLSRYHAENAHAWRSLAGTLQRFGRESGMFQQLDVRHLGRNAETGPFQVEFQMPGQRGKRNILDIGYGVSQILPILVECMEAGDQPLLLQQPEVHLHPRAQAELGTYLAQAVKASSRQFIVETHSDYLIDRLALAVRSSILDKRDVQLLFLETESGATTVHPMTFDETGTLLNAPDSYRQFFLDEQASLLGL